MVNYGILCLSVNIIFKFCYRPFGLWIEMIMYPIQKMRVFKCAINMYISKAYRAHNRLAGFRVYYIYIVSNSSSLDNVSKRIQQLH